MKVAIWSDLEPQVFHSGNGQSFDRQISESNVQILYILYPQNLSGVKLPLIWPKNGSVAGVKSLLQFPAFSTLLSLPQSSLSVFPNHRQF